MKLEIQMKTFVSLSKKNAEEDASDGADEEGKKAAPKKKSAGTAKSKPRPVKKLPKEVSSDKAAAADIPVYEALSNICGVLVNRESVKKFYYTLGKTSVTMHLGTLSAEVTADQMRVFKFTPVQLASWLSMRGCIPKKMGKQDAKAGHRV